MSGAYECIYECAVENGTLRDQDKSDIVTFEDVLGSVINDIKSMLISKNKSYGNSALKPCRIFSKANTEEQLKVRIDDKLNRIMKGKEYAGEDTINDLIGYLILLKINEKQKESK